MRRSIRRFRVGIGSATGLIVAAPPAAGSTGASSARQPPNIIASANRTERRTRERRWSDAPRHSARVRSGPTSSSARSRWLAPARRASQQRNAAIARHAAAPRNAGRAASRPMPIVSRSRRKAAQPWSARSSRSKTIWRATGPASTLPERTSKRRWLPPSCSTTCSRASAPRTTVVRQPSIARSRSSALPDGDVASTGRTLASTDAANRMRASSAALSAAS